MFNIVKAKEDKKNQSSNSSSSSSSSSGKPKLQKVDSIRTQLLQQELAELTSDVVPETSELVFEDVDDLRSFKIIVRPNDGVWKGGSFEFDVSCPESYNITPPKVLCRTMLWHPNIDTEGHVCLNILREKEWSPVQGIKGVVFGLDALFTDLADVSDPLNIEAAEEWKNDADAFERKAKQWVRKYAQ